MSGRIGRGWYWKLSTATKPKGSKTIDDIKVKVTRNGGRKYLTMYYDCPITGKRTQRSTRETKRRDAEREAMRWET